MARKTGKKAEETWFGARVLFEALHPQEKMRERVFEDRIILVKAKTEREAGKRAAKLGKAQKVEYVNLYGKKVRWVFRQVLDVAQLFDQRLREGSEVYYRFLNRAQLNLLRRALSPLGS